MTTQNLREIPPETASQTWFSRLLDDLTSGAGRRAAITSLIKSSGLHQVLLGLSLYGLLAVAGTHAVWSADEGALLYQASSLAEGGGWSFEHPFPEADPKGTAYPLHLSSWAVDEPDASVAQTCPIDGVGCRYISLAKHTSFVWIAAGLLKLGGYKALLLFSMFGTFCAAIGASKLAARIEPVAELPALWLVGIGSPLFINGYVAWAHAPTAALIVWAVHWLTDADDGPRRVMHLTWGFSALAAATLLRTEALLIGIAIGAGWIGIAVVRRNVKEKKLPLAAVGLGAFCATAFGTFVDRTTATPTAGPVEPPSFDEAFGLIDGRLEGFANTWLKPGYVMAPMDLLLLISAVALIAAAIFVRRGDEGRQLTRPAVLFAVACLALRFVMMPVALVPGLIVACPLLIVGLILLDRSTMRSEQVLVLLVPFVLFCGAVLATQYRGGGGGEWGGRYFAIGLPLGLVVATVGVIRTGRTFPTVHQRQIVAMLAAGILLLNLLGLFGLRIIRDRTTDLAAAISVAGSDAGDEDQRPVVVTTMNGLGRWLWQDLDNYRMLRVPSEELPELGRKLASLGIVELTLVSLSPEQDRLLLADWYGNDSAEGQADRSPTGETAGTVTNLRRR